MDLADEDVRSIEAVNVGAEDELDADLEREFQQQQEAKSRSRARSDEFCAGGDADNDELVMSAGTESREELEIDFRADSRWVKAELSPSAVAEGLHSDSAMQKSPELGRSFLRGRRTSLELNGTPIWKRAVGNKLTLFPEFEEVQLGSNTRTLGEKLSDKTVDGDSFGYDDKTELFEGEFQVPSPHGKEEAKWLGLGLPSNSDKYTGPSDKQVSNALLRKNRSSVSASSSRVATSLERQYSTGSTATVESPHFVVPERKGNDRPRPIREVHSSATPRLTFSFPGWGVEISKGEKHPSVISHHGGTALESDGHPTKRLRTTLDHSTSAINRGKGVEEYLGDRCPVWEMPDEILLHVMRRLDMRDLCSSVQTCKRWYAVGLHDDLWDQLLGDSDRGLLSDSSSDILPRWVCKKNLCLSENVRLRFHVFSKGYDYLRRALHEWWDNGLQNSRHSSKGMYSLIRKLTVNDWTLLYEALGVAFTDRADRIANMLLRKLKPAGRPTGDGTLSEPTNDGNRDYNGAIGNLAAAFEKSKSGYSLAGSSSEFELHWKSGSVKEVSQMEGVLGKELWGLLLKLWDRYKCWLHLISTHCPDLNREVMLEKSRSGSWTATPSVYNKGLICFRSQVVLRYGLRNVLQGGFMFLTTQDVRGCSSEHEVGLLRCSHHLLQELDVADDSTLPTKSHTQTKLRQCFRSALSTNSKLALHMNDKLNHL